jgi:positive phototaxis protein PixI
MVMQIELQESVKTQEINSPYLCMQLEPQTLALIDMAYAQEVLVISSERLTIMPNMPTHVLGLISHRSRVFWVIDLPHLLGLTPLNVGAQEYHLAVLRVHDSYVGLAMLQTQGVKRWSEGEMRSPVDYVSPELERYLQGIVLQKDDTYLVLDAKAIALPAQSEVNLY